MKNIWQTGLGLVTLAAMVAAVYMALVGAPTEAEQGAVQRIFYFHVPCAMVTFASFGLVAIAGALYLWLGSQISIAHFLPSSKLSDVARSRSATHFSHDDRHVVCATLPVRQLHQPLTGQFHLMSAGHVPHR